MQDGFRRSPPVYACTGPCSNARWGVCSSFATSRASGNIPRVTSRTNRQAPRDFNAGGESWTTEFLPFLFRQMARRRSQLYGLRLPVAHGFW